MEITTLRTQPSRWRYPSPSSKT